jgi:hypothetical protein
MRTNPAYWIGQAATIGGYKLEGMLRARAIPALKLYAEWSKEMVADLGAEITPHLKAIWGAMKPTREQLARTAAVLRPKPEPQGAAKQRLIEEQHQEAKTGVAATPRQTKIGAAFLVLAVLSLPFIAWAGCWLIRRHPADPPNVVYIASTSRCYHRSWCRWCRAGAHQEDIRNINQAWTPPCKECNPPTKPEPE